MARNLLAAFLVFVALVVQVTILNRLPVMVVPDLVLLVVIALAAIRGPIDGAVIGFLAGLAADILPPAGDVLGQYTLVMCVVGFVAGKLGEHVPLVATMLCAVLAPAFTVAVGGLVTDDGAGWTYMRTVWPWVALCNLVAAPAVLWAVRRLHRERGRQPVLVPSWRRI
ncbi:rod shape-determining protein MreD [Microtetraspora malaysiensis]|uniref:rod shape-determining protein MreD n=1 Tax=Microtetraspora malaysiensis TaxID=161358 RepID=UPI000A04E477|nr:rod shape-determining protein MreD [Microtetraspora malaysiensis]